MRIEEYLICREELDRVAQEKLKWAQEEKRLYNKLGEIGKDYTAEKRISIITQAKEMKQDIVVINELEEIHSKWEEGKVTHFEIMAFAELHINIINYRQGAYKDSKLVKLRNFLLGGENDE
ncbi:hypothetical protein [Bacillus cereus]|uniref:hypothetical protein n=1 Tax=Bacillus cereus TaxID=1396 RepID=UPI003D2ED976